MDYFSRKLGSVEEGASLTFLFQQQTQMVKQFHIQKQLLFYQWDFTLNSSTGAITGTAPAVSANTTNTFTGRASDGTNIADRIFNIIVNNAPEGGNNNILHLQ